MSAKGPRKLADILSEVIARRGTAKTTVQLEIERSWKEAAGERAASRTRVGALRRGELEILVDNPALLMELEGYYKDDLLAAMQRSVRHCTIRKLRFRRL